MDNKIKVGEYYKHFKGKSLVEKNIYIILETNVIYTGEKMSEVKDLVIYKNIFDNKIFVREESDILKELNKEQQAKYNQKTRIQKLTKEEIKIINSVEFKEQKIEYLNNK